jgi:hypothetical protein
MCTFNKATRRITTVVEDLGTVGLGLGASGMDAQSSSLESTRRLTS